MRTLYEDVPKLFTPGEWSSFIRELPGYMDYYEEYRRRYAGQGR